MKKLTLIIVSLFCLNFSYGQQIAKSEYGSFLLSNATIETVTKGTIEGNLLITDGKIAAIGKDVQAEDAKVIDCSGLYIYPGMIDGGTKLGLSEISAVSLTKDYDEIGSFSPHLEALTAINPNSVSIPVTRVNGITTVLASPDGGLFPGKASLINLNGYTPDQMYAGFKASVLNFPSTGKRGRWDRRSEEDIKKDAEKAMKKLNEFWKQVQIYAKAKAAGANDLDYNPQLSSLSDVINGTDKLLIRANRKADIIAAISWMNKNEVSGIITGASEGWRAADSLAKYEIPVIAGPVLNQPGRRSDRYDAPYTNVSKMVAKGVKVALMTGETENVRNLPYHAGFAATYGLGKEEALKAVTIIPAEIFGVADKYGSIEVGKMANLFIIDGDPFETKSQLSHLFIEGWKVPLESRHTLLYDEFIKRSPGLEKK